ncbi:hypothetical protein [Streptomyces sp. NPDC001315]|uniref:MmyB family transcriptional regulator n=1 Tax=Streptomyces sp. NPDC001315 TaxID=3364562 RepID=UPI00368501BC
MAAAAPSPSTTITFDHPQVGSLELRHEKLLITHTDRQTLVIYHADPGTPTAERRALLASLASTPAPSSAERAASDVRRPASGVHEPTLRAAHTRTA